MLFNSHKAVKQYADVFFNKPESHGWFYSVFCRHNISIHILSISTVVLYCAFQYEHRAFVKQLHLMLYT